MSLGIAIGAFLKALVNKRFGEEIKAIALDMKSGNFKKSETKEVDEPVKKEEKIEDTVSDREMGAIQVLGILQKEGRFIDFMKEDLSEYGDEEIGAAVRSVHEGCRKVIHEKLELEKIIDQPEESTYRVNADYPAHLIHLNGKVSEKYPLKGTLVHPGWKVNSMSLPNPATKGEKVLAPAQVEIE